MVRKERRAGDITPEFRAEAVRRVLASGKPITVMAKELGIDHRTLWAWVDKVRLERIDPEGVMPVEARRRIRELESENARLACRSRKKRGPSSGNWIATRKIRCDRPIEGRIPCHLFVPEVGCFHLGVL